MKNKEHYDKLSKLITFKNGKPYWIDDIGFRVKSGDLAGCLVNGYRKIGIKALGVSVHIPAHRLNFYMEYSHLPRMIDHIDRNPDNNDISNLRECNNAQNRINTSKTSGCSSRYKGVSWSVQRGKWMASIMVRGKSLNLGGFTRESDAGIRYNESAIKYFGDFACINEI